LQGVKSKKSDFRRVGMTEYGEYAALVLGTVLKNGVCRWRMVHAHCSYTPSMKKEKSFALF